MVTKQGNADKMPDEWKSQIRELARNVGVMSEEDTRRAIEVLVDRCVTEAVLTLIAEMMASAPDKTLVTHYKQELAKFH